MPNKIISVKGLHFTVRPDKLDEYVVKENLCTRVYLRHVQLAKDQLWLDIGAHIGAFALSIAESVKGVFCFEPEPENYALLKQNITLNHVHNIRAKQCAVVASEEAACTLYLNTKQNTGSHSLVVKRGRTPLSVRALNIGTLLEATGITCIKLDAEGAERELLPAILNSNVYIEQLVMEYHFAALRDLQHHGYREVIRQLKQQFPYVFYKEDPKKAWHTVVYASRLEPTC